MQEDTVYDETIVSYMELYCFLGAYFQYTVSDDRTRQRALEEVAQFCTPSFIQRVVTQIDALLATHQNDSDTLLEWLERIANGWKVENAEQARTYLRELQVGLREALQQYRHHPSVRLAYASPSRPARAF